jgi:hypothetical protein
MSNARGRNYFRGHLWRVFGSLLAKMQGQNKLQFSGGSWVLGKCGADSFGITRQPHRLVGRFCLGRVQTGDRNSRPDFSTEVHVPRLLAVKVVGKRGVKEKKWVLSK